MRISNRTIYAVAGTLALLTIAVRSQSDPRPATQNDSLVAQAEVNPRPATNYDRTRRSTASTDRAASEVARIPAASLPGERTRRTQATAPLPDEPEMVVDEPEATTPEPQVNAGDSGFDETGTLAQTAPATPAQAGELTDQAVYELYVSSLDDENRRAFRATWALMAPEEKQEWLAGARTALSGN